MTVPHKLAALELADRRSPAATAIGAANTLTLGRWRRARREHRRRGLPRRARRGPARAARARAGRGWRRPRRGLGAERGGRATWRCSTAPPSGAEALARDLGVRHARAPEPADLLVNCTTVGLGAADDALAALGVEAMEPPAVAVDLVYGDAPSTLLCVGRARRGARGRWVGGAGSPGRAQPRAVDWRAPVPGDDERRAARARVMLLRGAADMWGDGSVSANPPRPRWRSACAHGVLRHLGRA